MKSLSEVLKNITVCSATIILLSAFSTLSAELKPKERNILASESKAIDLAKILVTDYLEFIRSGDRRQDVYDACSEALNSLVMGELAEGKGRFMDQIINAVWYFSEQTWWGWSAHLGTQKADADATTRSDASAVYRYGKAINDPIMMQFGAYLGKLGKFGDHKPDGKICDQIKNLTLVNEIKNAPAKEALVADFWLPDTEVGGARDKEGSFTGFFFGAKGGFNNESHNHNDIGSCVMYYDGKPYLIDLGREEYNAKTFSPRRYEIWTMQSGFHNLPVINGRDQKEGANFKARNSAFTASSKTVKFSTDIGRME